MIGQLSNHLWQSTLFALTAALLTLAFRANRARVRHSLWLIASLKFLVPFSFLIGLGAQFQWSRAAREIAAVTPSPGAFLAVQQLSEPFESAAPAAPALPQPHFGAAPLALAAAWLSGFAALACLRYRAWRRIRAALRRSAPLIIPHPVEARLSPDVLEPGVVGITRPILLLPEGIIERLTPSELEAVIAHELCHIRRRDNLFASIHMLVEALFWFHPLIWWIGARLVSERERSCDEDVVRLGNQPEVYAQAILNVCKLYAESPLACVSGVTGADIRRRIEVIMSSQVIAGLSLGKKALLACAGVVAVAGPVTTGVLIGIGHVRPVFAQMPLPRPAIPQPLLPAEQQSVTPAKPAEPPPAKPALKFDVVSIKPCAPGTAGRGRGGGGPVGAPIDGQGGYFSVTPGRFSVSCGTLMTMIDWAYHEFGDDQLVNDPRGPGMAPERIRGLPDWALSTRYTIEAESEDPAAKGPAQRMSDPAHRLMSGPMFRALLEDRFQLKMHRALEDVPMYALTVAKGGLKMNPAADDDCTDPTHTPNGGTLMSRDLIQRLAAAPFDSANKPYCNWMGVQPHGANRVLLGGTVSLSRVAELLSTFVMDRHVIDKTGISGKFNIRVEYTPDERTPCRAFACDADPDNADIPAGPDIFRALEERLGLKLESTRAPHGYFVIDHVERPSEN